MPRTRENISLTQKNYDIAGNTIRAYYDATDKLVFVLDETINADKPNVLLVIDSFDGRKWDDVLANDYHVDLETVRPKRDNKYQKLDIEYGGLDVYANLIAAYDADDDVSDALVDVANFRAMAVRRSATERLSAAEETINKSRETIERTNETISELRAKVKDLRGRLTKQRGDIGREPTKASAAKILKTEAQLDATNEKLARAKKRITSAQRRLAAAEDDAEIARAILARDVPQQKKTGKKTSSVPAVQKPQPIVSKQEQKAEEMNDDEEIKPLFDKDPENLDDSIAFKPIDFGTPELPQPSEKQITSSVPDDEENVPAPLSFTPPPHEEKIPDFVDDTKPDDAPGPMLDSLTPIDDYDNAAPVSQIEPAPVPEPIPEPLAPVAPIASTMATRPVSPITGGMASVDAKPQRSTLLYYVMLIFLIVLSIVTLWLYQKTTADNVPDLAKSAPEMVAPDVMQKPATEQVVPETPTPFVAATNVATVSEPAPVDVPVAEPVTVSVEPEPVVEVVSETVAETVDLAEPEPIATESPFVEPEPVVKYESEPVYIPSEAEVMATKPGYNVSQNEKMFIASDNYETETGIPICEGGVAPDSLGCCPGETYTYTEDGFMCCNSVECFPPAE